MIVIAAEEEEHIPWLSRVYVICTLSAVSHAASPHALMTRQAERGTS